MQLPVGASSSASPLLAALDCASACRSRDPVERIINTQQRKQAWVVIPLARHDVGPDIVVTAERT